MKNSLADSIYALTENSDIKDVMEMYISDSDMDYTEVYHREYDIIVPIYNGYNYFSRLFPSLERTKANYRLILIDDCSTDKNVNEFLKAYKSEHKKTILIKHKENLGFVRSVNDGLKMAQNDVVILNTDVQLPGFWLERLMLPLVKDNEVASATPFTNSGTICSFPKFLEDNNLFANGDLDDIDKFFAKIKPQYMEAPTGVGFCMAMSKLAIDRVGFLDDKTFSKGYCEENDWCQRAIKEGFKNVIVENLFVFHNHGGSFESEERKRLNEINLKLLNAKHPHYIREVASYCNKNPHKELREFLICILASKLCRSCLVLKQVKNENVTNYVDDFTVEKVQNKEIVTVLLYNLQQEYFKIQFYYLDFEIYYNCYDTEDLLEFFKLMKFDEIVANSDLAEELVATIFPKNKIGIKRYIANSTVSKLKVRPLLAGKQLRQIIKADNVVLYGAGDFAGKVINCLEQFEIKISCLAVTDKSKNPDEAYGIRVKEITELNGMKENTVIVIAVDEKLAKQISAYVKLLEFPNVVMLNY